MIGRFLNFRPIIFGLVFIMIYFYLNIYEAILKYIDPK